MDVSVIVPIYNGLSFLPAFYESLAASAPEGCQLILVDDASSEPVFDALPDAPLFSNALRLRNDVNLGYSGAVNRGFTAASGSLLVQLNTDLVLHKGCIEAFIRHFEREPNAGVLGSKLIFPTTGRVQHVGMAFGRFSKRHIFLDMPADHPVCSKTRRVQIMTGATVAMTRPLFDAIGPLDERYYNYNEDIDHCLKANALGYPNYVLADSVAYHWVSQSGPARFSGVKEAEAIFWGDWAERREIDLKCYMREALEALLKVRPDLAAYPFQVLNLCRSLDEQLLFEVIDEIWPGVSERAMHFRAHGHAGSKLSLPLQLPHWAVQSPRPFLYLADTASSLFENELWFETRNRIVAEEIVLDLNGAAYLSSDFGQ